MSEVSRLKGTILLCDWAEAIGGKLYAQGIGWVATGADRPLQFAVACIFRVPYDETNKKHSASIKLVTEDGHPYPEVNPVEAGFEFALGRPPGMRHGEEQVVPFAIRVGIQAFTAGAYRFELYMDGELVDTVSFTAKSDGPGVSA